MLYQGILGHSAVHIVMLIKASLLQDFALKVQARFGTVQIGIFMKGKK